MFSKEALAIIVVGAFLLGLLLQGQLGTTVIDNASLLSWGLIMMLVLVEGVDAQFRHKSPKIVTPAFVTTYSAKDIMSHGDFLIVRLGGVQAYGFYWPGNEGTLVVHKSAVNYIGDSIVITAMPEVVSFEELPPETRPWIEQLGLPEPHLMALVSEADLRKPDVAAIVQKIKAIDRANKELEDLAMGRLEVLEKAVEKVSTITETRKGILSELIRRLTAPEEEEKK